MTVLAEGIETQAQLERLRHLRCEAGRLPVRLPFGGEVAAMLGQRPATGTRAWHRHRPRSLPLLGVRRIRLAQATLPIRISRTADQFRQVPLLRCSTSLSVADVAAVLRRCERSDRFPRRPGKAWTVAIDVMTQWNDFAVVHLDSIDKRLLEHLYQMTGCTAPASLARRRGRAPLQREEGRR